MTPTQKLKKLTGEEDTSLLELLYESAETEIKALTNRSELNEPLVSAAIRWAVIAWNRMGIEGESSRTEAGISSAFIDVPEQVLGIVRQYRIARCGGIAHAKESADSSDVPAETSS